MASDSWDNNLESVPLDSRALDDEPIDRVASDDSPLCIECGLSIPYAGRGRKPKRHEACKPSGSRAPNRPRTAGRTKAEREAADLAERFFKGINKTAVMVAPFDTYDAFCLAAGSKPLADQLEGVLVTHDSWRVSLAALQGQGSVIGLVLAAAMIAAPIAAHHSFIPGTVNGIPIREVLEKMPERLYQLQKRAEAAADDLAGKLHDAGNAEHERSAA